MKKSKLIALTLTLIFILTACGEGGGGYLFYDFATIQPMMPFATKDGAIYTLNLPNGESGYQKIEYTDFESGEATVLCAKPGCTHEFADETCHANVSYDGESALIQFATNEKFYYISTSGNQETGEQFSDLYESDFNRQNERLVTSFSGTQHFIGSVYRDSVYMFTRNHLTDNGDGSGSQEDLMKVNLGSYDLKNGDLSEIEIIKGYNVSVPEVYGVYEEKQFYQITYTNEAIDWETATEEEIQEITSSKVELFFSLDTESMEIKESDDFASLLNLDFEIEAPYLINDNILYYSTKGVLYAYDLKEGENTTVYEGSFSSVKKAGDKILCSVNYENNEAFIYDPETKESKAVYRPYGGDWTLGYFLWHEHGDYIYMDSSSQAGAVGEYEQYDPFIMRVHKDDIYKEEYEAEIVS